MAAPAARRAAGRGPAPAFGREDLFAAWTAFFERVGADGDAVVLVFDDVQYADDGLLDFLDHLLGDRARSRCFVLRAGPPRAAGAPARRSATGAATASSTSSRSDDAAMATLVDGLVAGLPDAARGPRWSRAPRASRCTPSRRCAR